MVLKLQSGIELWQTSFNFHIYTFYGCIHAQCLYEMMWNKLICITANRFSAFLVQNDAKCYMWKLKFRSSCLDENTVWYSNWNWKLSSLLFTHPNNTTFSTVLTLLFYFILFFFSVIWSCCLFNVLFFDVSWELLSMTVKM